MLNTIESFKDDYVVKIDNVAHLIEFSKKITTSW